MFSDACRGMLCRLCLLPIMFCSDVRLLLLLLTHRTPDPAPVCRYLRLDGSTPIAERRDLVDAWQVRVEGEGVLGRQRGGGGGLRAFEGMGEGPGKGGGVVCLCKMPATLLRATTVCIHCV